MPLLIGGATTSRIHTALQGHAGVHERVRSCTSPMRQPRGGRDLQAAVGRHRSARRLHDCARRRVHPRGRGARAGRGRAQPTRHRRCRAATPATSRSTRAPSWRRRSPACAAFDDVDVADLVPYFDWTPFFHAWGLRGRYPSILTDAELGEAAQPLYDDARRMLDRIVAERWFEPKAVVGFWQAHRGDGDAADDIVLPDRGPTPPRAPPAAASGATTSRTCRSPTSSRRPPPASPTTSERSP